MGLFSDIKEGLFGANSPGGVLSGQGARESSERIAREQIRFQEQSRELFRPIVEAGISQIDPLARSATAEGFGQNLGEIINSGALDPLIQQRAEAAEQVMAQRGLRRSGAAVREAARVPADLSLQIESELNRRRQSIAGQGQSGAGNLGNINTMMGQILGRSASDQAAISQQGQQNAAAIMGAMFSAFSDPRLKTNIQIVGKHKDLNVIEWDWNDYAFIKYGFKGSSIGFNAEEVKDKHPDCVLYEDGLLKVDYEKVLRLQ